MSVDTKDILLKAAEDVQQGMWCAGFWFHDGNEAWVHLELFRGELSVEKAMKAERCAEGSIALATKLLGGDFEAYLAAVESVERRLPTGKGLASYNDAAGFGGPFEAGQAIAELFRQTAEAL